MTKYLRAYFPATRMAAAVTGFALLVALTFAGGARAATTLSPPLAQLDAAAYLTLQSYMTQSSSLDTRYYSTGSWRGTDGPLCWYCYNSAAVGAATLSQQPGADPTLLPVAIATFNADVANHQLASGAIADANGNPDAIGTGFWAVNLGMTYLELQSSLSPTTRAAWSAAIQNAANYLITSGMTTWYVNGNVNLRQSEVMWLAWVITHQPRFLTAYDSEYAFAVAPPQARWPGFGLQITTAPTKSDDSDGAGYLAERGSGALGFDPAYSQAQLDTATDLYILTRDPRYIQLMNLLFNQLRQRLNMTTWVLDATNGSRSNYMTPFMSAGLSVLVASGDRPDLAASVTGQLTNVDAQYQNAQKYTYVNFYKGFESWISGTLLVNQWPRGMAPDTRVPPGPPPAGTPGSIGAASPTVGATAVALKSPGAGRASAASARARRGHAAAHRHAASKTRHARKPAPRRRTRRGYKPGRASLIGHRHP